VLLVVASERQRQSDWTRHELTAAQMTSARPAWIGAVWRRRH
jgi:hypothetical protein